MKHFFWLAALLTCSCSYRAVYSAAPPSERLSVVVGENQVAEAEAVRGVLAAVRSELRAAGAFKPGAGYPRLVVDVLRVDEAASGLREAVASPPRARASVVAVTARARVFVSDSSTAADTGDIRRSAQFASGATPVIDGDGYGFAVLAAARRSGTALARRVLGLPEPGYGPL